jgi:hypothetical protein
LSDERRNRENEAPRLLASVPTLVTLSLAIEDRSDRSVARPKHIRRVVVESAPALFLIDCSDSNCKEGGHDLTEPIMRSLLRGETSFRGEDPCYGSLGTAACTRVLHFDATAEYAASR